MMNRITPLILVLLFASLLAACGEADSAVPVTGQGSGLQLTVESPGGENALRQGQEAITYNYVVTNNGPQPLSGPVIVEDAPRLVICPQLNTVGNMDHQLDFNESITCTAHYTPSETDRSAGSITNRARAIAGGALSNEDALTLSFGQGTAAATLAGPGASQTPSAFPTITSGSTQPPSVISTVTPDSAAASTVTPALISSATPEASADTTQTPSVIPTATLGSSGDVTPGATASAGTVNIIDLPAGTESILLPGVVPPGGSIRYSIATAAGQQLILNFIVTTNVLSLSVTGPDGAVIKAGEAAMPWSGTLSSAGDYLIDVLNTDSAAAQPYLLELRLSPGS